MSSLAKVILLSSIAAFSTVSGAKELPNQMEVHVESHLFEQDEGGIEAFEVVHEPFGSTTGILHLDHDEKDFVKADATWLGEDGTHYRTNMGFLPKAPFVSYMLRAPQAIPYPLVDAGDGTWQFAENRGLWIDATVSGLRMYQGALVKEIVVPDRPPLRPVTRLRRREIPLGLVETQVGAIPEKLGLIASPVADQNFFVGTEGRTPLSVIVLGYETFDTAHSKLGKRNIEDRGFENGGQVAWIVPRVHFANPAKKLFPIYRIPVFLLQFAGENKSLELISSPKQFSESAAESWLQTYFERNHVVELTEKESLAALMDFRANAIGLAMSRTYGVKFVPEILSPGGMPLPCSRAIINVPNQNQQGAD